MIFPAPTTPIDPVIARGVLESQTAATATKPAFITLSFGNTNYRMHLLPEGPITGDVGKRILGTIRARARRIDVVTTGGRYVEPVFGRPRRVQGSVIAVAGDAVVVDAGMPIHIVPTDPRQKAGDFKAGQFVSCDVMDGATFAPAL